MNVEAMKEYASKMLEMILKSKDKEEFFRAYLNEGDIFTIPTADSQGNKVDSKYAKMEAIYDKYRREPNCKIDELLYNTLEKSCPIVKSSSGIVGLLRTIEYQMGAEKENRAPFQMDCQYLLGLVKINLIGNKQIYDRPIYAEENFWGKMQEFDRIFRGYGYHIMEQEQEANGPVDCISHKTETESAKTQNGKPGKGELTKAQNEEQSSIPPKKANTAAVANTAKSGSGALQKGNFETRSSDKITKLIKAIKKNCKKLWEGLSRK